MKSKPEQPAGVENTQPKLTKQQADVQKSHQKVRGIMAAMKSSESEVAKSQPASSPVTANSSNIEFRNAPPFTPRDNRRIGEDYMLPQDDYMRHSKPPQDDRLYSLKLTSPEGTPPFLRSAHPCTGLMVPPLTPMEYTSRGYDMGYRDGFKDGFQAAQRRMQALGLNLTLPAPIHQSQTFPGATPETYQMGGRIEFSRQHMQPPTMGHSPDSYHFTQIQGRVVNARNLGLSDNGRPAHSP